MLVAIYHMIRDDADFHPVDHEDIKQNTKKTKGLNLNHVIVFLREQGADESTIQLVETQCSVKATETADICSKSPIVQDAKEKQSTSESADVSQPVQESINGSPVLVSGSQQGRTLNQHSKVPAVTTATA